MKYIIFLITLILLSSCGTTGHIVFYDFSSSKYEVEKELLNIINKDSIYSVPDKWKSHTEGDYFERIYIYFPSSPEELYQIGFNGDSTEWNNSLHGSRLGFVSIYQGDQFKYESDLNNKEIARITKRFEDSILSKVKYHYNKSY